jgi:O-6-methylguanine DNA methyltransferase
MLKKNAPQPTKLQQRVWDALNRIPTGTVTTYGALAKHLKTKAVRAVGTAVGKNPNAPQCPCHRVVRADGKIGNYSGKGGAQGKIALLTKEGVRIEDGRVDLQACGFYF